MKALRVGFMVWSLAVSALALSLEESKVSSQSSAENDLYFVRVISHETSPDFRIELEIVDKQTNVKIPLSIGERFQTVSELLLVQKSMLAVIGKLRRGGDIISIVDLEKRLLQNTIWAYGFAFSPSKRFLIYQTHYPRMGPGPMKHSIVLLYDLCKPVPDNRLPPLEFGPPENIGTPVFPEANLREKSYNIRLDPGHLYTSAFLWSEDESEVVFLDFYPFRQDMKGESYINVIDFNEDKSVIGIRRSRIEVSDFVLFQRMPERERVEKEQTGYKFPVKAIAWHGTDEIIVQPYPQVWLPAEVVLALPKRD